VYFQVPARLPGRASGGEDLPNFLSEGSGATRQRRTYAHTGKLVEVGAEAVPMTARG